MHLFRSHLPTHGLFVPIRRRWEPGTLLFPSFSLSFSRRDRDSLTPSLFSASAVRPPVKEMSCRWEEQQTQVMRISGREKGCRHSRHTGTSGRGAQQATHRVQQVHSPYNRIQDPRRKTRPSPCPAVVHTRSRRSRRSRARESERVRGGDALFSAPLPSSLS